MRKRYGEIQIDPLPFIAPIQAVAASGDVSAVNEATAVTEVPATQDLAEERAPDQIDLSQKAVVFVTQRWPRAWKRSGVALLLVLGIFTVWILRPGSQPPRVIRSLAVLPLENLSGDASQEYFSDGMTDELITELGQISELRVISRTSVMTYKGAHKPLPQIAQELNVDAVVEGTVLRSGEQVRITAQLIQAAADKHLWAQSYESNLHDMLALQKRSPSPLPRRSGSS
jgi:TolB-like protein